MELKTLSLSYLFLFLNFCSLVKYLVSLMVVNILLFSIIERFYYFLIIKPKRAKNTEIK